MLSILRSFLETTCLGVPSIPARSHLTRAYHRFGMTLGGYFTGVRTDSDFLGLGLTSNPGYARFDIATHYNFGHGFHFYARATNLFDKQYQDALGYPALGRDFRAGVRYTFKGKN